MYTSDFGFREKPFDVTPEPRFFYPVPQNAPCGSAGINVLNSLQGKRPKATDVSPWYGVYTDPSYQEASTSLLSGIRVNVEVPARFVISIFQEEMAQ